MKNVDTSLGLERVSTSALAFLWYEILIIFKLRIKKNPLLELLFFSRIRHRIFSMSCWYSSVILDIELSSSTFSGPRVVSDMGIITQHTGGKVIV